MVILQPFSPHSSNKNSNNNKNTEEHSSNPSSSSYSSPALPISPTSPLPHPNLPIIDVMPPLLPHLLYPPPMAAVPQYHHHHHHHYHPVPVQYPYFTFPSPPSPSLFYYLPEFVPYSDHFNPHHQPTLTTGEPQSHIVTVDSTTVDDNRNHDEFLRRVEGGNGGLARKRNGRFKKLWKPKGRTSSSGNGNGNGNASGSRSSSPPRLPPPPPPVVEVEGSNSSDCTTLMIRNIPNTISRRTLINMLDNHCREQNFRRRSSRSEYDFLYLPFDFKRKNNMGYAFVNFTTVEGASRLKICWTGKGWDSSSKIRLITRARLQGIDQCKKHFQNSLFFCHSDEYLPVEFSPPRDGWNGETCKITSVGRWAHENKARWSEKFWSPKGNTLPPRLSR